jgi:hypothetical protein
MGGKGKMVTIVGSNKNDAQVAHPVVVVMGSLKELVTYMPANASSIIEHGNKSLTDNSISIVMAIPSESTHHQEGNESLEANEPPLYSSHFLWRCKVQSGPGYDPQVVESLMDNGSQPVLINNVFVTDLGLKHRKLHKPETI